MKENKETQTSERKIHIFKLWEYNGSKLNRIKR